MNNLMQCMNDIMAADVLTKLIISKPAKKTNEYRKIVIEKKNGYQIAKYTEKQVFHENVSEMELAERVCALTEGVFRQINAFSEAAEHMIMISKDGNFNYKKRMMKSTEKVAVTDSHNRKKHYLIEEGDQVAPLVDMGIFTKEGKVVRTMYDKFKQINRFLEILDDEIGNMQFEHLNVIDFGCGKSYLTFVVYYYLTEIKKISVNIIGLDLKADVIKKCNESAERYGYKNLKFELGDINGYKAPFDVDMVITLHACDTATDFALYNAICWKAKIIFSVPCCQHELNQQIQTQDMALLTRYGIIKERFAALATDAIRGNLLEYCGYKTQLLEFVDMSHTPKNILIRAVKRPINTKAQKETVLREIDALIEEFNFEPTLYKLLISQK